MISVAIIAESLPKSLLVRVHDELLQVGGNRRIWTLRAVGQMELCDRGDILKGFLLFATPKTRHLVWQVSGWRVVETEICQMANIHSGLSPLLWSLAIADFDTFREGL